MIDGYAFLAEELCFFARFEVEPTEINITTITITNESSNIHDNDVGRVFTGVNSMDVTGPNGVTGRILKVWANQFFGKFK